MTARRKKATLPVMTNDPWGVIIATKTEAAPFIDTLRLERQSGGPFPFYWDRDRGDIVLVLSGVGKVRAATAAAALIERFSPRAVVNLGAAGATAGDAVPGTVFQVRSVIEADLYGARPLVPSIELEGVPPAVLATADLPVLDGAARARLAGSADLADMEGAAIARVCRLYSVPCHIGKVVTDRGGEAVEEIIESMGRHAHRLRDYFVGQVLPGLRREEARSDR